MRRQSQNRMLWKDLNGLLLPEELVKFIDYIVNKNIKIKNNLYFVSTAKLLIQ